MTRREFTKDLVATLVLYSFLQTSFSVDAFAREVKPIMAKWLRQLYEMCRDLRRATISLVEWQRRIEALHTTISLTDLLQFIDFDRLLAGVRYPADIGAVIDVRFPRIQGLPNQLGFGRKIFAYKRGAATPPHAHNNIVSAHLIVKGKVHTRTYDRLRDEGSHLILTPTRDAILTPGTTVSMSDEKDNVHWFTGASEYSYTFDVPLANVVVGKQYPTEANKYGMIYVDPVSERPRAAQIRAKIITFPKAVAKFGGRLA